MNALCKIYIYFFLSPLKFVIFHNYTDVADWLIDWVGFTYWFEKNGGLFRVFFDMPLKQIQKARRRESGAATCE